MSLKESYVLATVLYLLLVREMSRDDFNVLDNLNVSSIKTADALSQKVT